MPDIKHNFTGGKMNKDLDERLVPKGEYRDAMNIKVQTSEGSDVGTIQNILGNNFGCDYSSYTNPIPSGSTTVGSISDEKNDTLYWLVAGPGDGGSCTSLAVGAECSFKDVIMRTSTFDSTPPASVVGCEPVFVDKYGWCLGVAPMSGFQNTVPIDPAIISNVTVGMSITGYNNGAQVSSTLVTGIGPSNSIPNLSYYQGSNLVTLTPTTSTFANAGLRTFWSLGCTGGPPQYDFDELTPCNNTNPYQLNLPQPGESQIFLPSINQDVVVGATISNSSVYPSGGTITDINFGMICDMPMGGCHQEYLLTIDTVPLLNNLPSVSTGNVYPNSWGTGTAPAGNENLFVPFSVDITKQGAVMQVPNNTIHMLPGSDSWLDEIYNILYDAAGSPTGAELEIDNGYSGGSNFPPNTCIDPASVINAADGFDLSANSYDDFFELIECSSGTTPGASVNGLNMNPTNRPIRLIATNSVGIESLFLRDSIDMDYVDTLCFASERVLNFEPNKLITGINIVDDMLFWTDGYHDATNKLQGTEPKKINITRSLQGTAFDGMTHTDLYVDGVSEGPAREEHVTVIRKAPLGPPTLEMTSQVREGILGGVDVLLSNTTSPAQKPFSGKSVGNEVWIVIDAVNNNHANFVTGDILRIQANTVDFNLPAAYDLRLEIIQKEDPGFDIPSVVDTTSGFQTAYLVKILTISSEDKLEETTFFTVLEEGDSLFERKFPRFAYRYKYVDNEYSSFGPFSEVAFIPGNFSYAPIEAYNLGMTNRVKSLKIKDFVSNETPRDVVRVDILYKNETSPTVYLLDSISRNDSTNYWNTSSYEVTSENIFAALPASQSLRVWDNVPRLARAQEITGNRLVYGNYLQGYDVTQHQYNSTLLVPNITTSLSSRVVDSTDYSGNQSIKSLRTYSVGVVWGDKYGRETPVITSTNSSLIVPKSKSLDSSYLTVDIDTSPYWADYYRYYVKETSNEYYNLPVDRVYDAEDGNIWVSFPSVDRNKVDEDTYIILKKGFDSNELILEEARYKIVAIESEAPEHIRTSYELLARSNTDGSRYPNSCNVYGGSAFTPCSFGNDSWNAPSVGRKGFSLKYSHWSGDYSNDGTTYAMALPSPIALWEEVKENSGSSTIDELFVSFSKEITDADGLTVTTESSKYRIVNVEEILDDPDDPTSEVLGWYMDLDSAILAEDDFIVGDGNMQADNMHQRFWKRAVRKKAEFDGRFFVKILSDTSANINLRSKVGAIGHWKVDASMKLYSIDDSKLNIIQNNYNVATAGDPSVSTRTADHWNTILKFGGSTPKSRWFIDRASFASNQTGDPTAISGNYNNVQTNFTTSPTGFTLDSCDTTSYFPQQVQSYCTVGGYLLEDLPSPDYDQNVGTGESSGMIGMKGVHENSSEKFFDLGYSKLGIQGATGQTTDYSLGWEESTGDEAVVKSLKIDKRFKLKGDTDDVVYKILGITKHRLFNYQGKKTASTSTFPLTLAQLMSNNYVFCGPWWNIQHMDQVSEMGDPKNRRVTYRIKYEVDHASSPTGTCTNDAADPFNDCPKLSDNGVFGAITSSSSVVMYFIEEFRVDGENPISNNPAIFETEPKEDVGLDLYYEASSSLTVFPITNENKHSYIPMGSTIMLPPTISSLGSIPEGIFITNWEYINPTSPVYTIRLSLALDQNQFDLLTSQTYLNLQKDNGEIVQAKIEGGTINAGYYNNIEISPISKTGLSWFNCWSFNNGVESNRVGDTFNKPFLTNGATVSTTIEEGVKEEHRKYGLIYSGLYNSNSGVNGLNQFITAEKITKDINPIYGSIQKLHSGWGQGGDLLALCEDRVLKILANKDALYNADGNSNVTSTNSVLGQTMPYSGEYGISKNPESFASDAYRAYFTDKVRGTVMRLSMDGLTPISEHGMKDWFRDNLKLNNNLIGSYDDRQNEYNLTLPTTTENSPQARTVSFNEGVKGWESFKSFVYEDGISCANDYYTFKNGNLYKHHDATVDRNTFYPYESTGVVVPGNYTDSSFTVLINESPGTVKTFHTLNYEGSQSKVDELTTYNTLVPGTSVIANTYNDKEYYNINGKKGWYVQYITTDLEQGSLNEFIEKEGKWFNYIKGTPGSITDGANIDGFGSSDISFQGIGRLQMPAISFNVEGCMDNSITTHVSYNYDYPSSLNYNPDALIDDGSCVVTEPGCTDAGNSNYDASHNWDIYQNLGYYVSGACAYYGCTDDGTNPSFPGRPNDAVGPALNYDSSANVDDSSCTYPVYGCRLNVPLTTTDPYTGLTINYLNFINYDSSATDECDGTVGPPCVPLYVGSAVQTGPNCCCVGYYAGCMQCGTIWETDNAAVCPGGPATTPGAINFDPMANNQPSPGYCTFPPVLGCIDSTACNYDPAADTDDGSCVYCGDDTANNFDSADSSCTTECIYCADVPLIVDIATADTLTATWTENWGMPSNATVVTYRLRYRETGTTSWSVIYNIAPTASSGAMNYTIGGLTANVSYEVQVKALCSNTNSNWSSTATMTTSHIMGCTTPGSVNYDASATQNDGSCIPCVFGCIDEYAADGTTLNSNWDPLATCDDGSCTACVFGCTNATACNYDASATCDDGSCFDCLPAMISQFNLSGSFSSDGSVPAVISNDEVTILYDAATPDNSIRHRLRYRETGATTWVYLSDHLYSQTDPEPTHQYGAAVVSDTFTANTSYEFQMKTVCCTSGCVSGLVCQTGWYGQTFNVGDNLGCTDDTATNYDDTATAEHVPSSCFVNSGSGCYSYGCLDYTAANYNSTVACDDGSCIWLGCTDHFATNFDSAATTDDSSCTY